MPEINKKGEAGDATQYRSTSRTNRDPRPDKANGLVGESGGAELSTWIGRSLSDVSEAPGEGRSPHPNRE